MTDKERIELLRAALEHIAQPYDYGCGCSFPCQCNTEASRAIHADGMKDIAEEALEALAIATTAPSAQGQDKWREAVLHECMMTECVAPDDSDPIGTIKRLVSYHVDLDRSQQQDSERLAFVLEHGLPFSRLADDYTYHVNTPVGQGFKTKLEAIDAAIQAGKEGK